MCVAHQGVSTEKEDGKYNGALNERGNIDRKENIHRKQDRKKVFDCKKSWLFDIQWPQTCSENNLSDNSQFRSPPLPSLLNLNFYLHPSSSCWGAKTKKCAQMLWENTTQRQDRKSNPIKTKIKNTNVDKWWHGAILIIHVQRQWGQGNAVIKRPSAVFV